MNHLYGLTEDELYALEHEQQQHYVDIDRATSWPMDIDWDRELQFDLDGDVCFGEKEPEEKGVKRKAEGKPDGERGAKRREISPERPAIIPNVPKMPVGFGRCPRPTEAEVASERLYHSPGEAQSKSY